MIEGMDRLFNTLFGNITRSVSMSVLAKKLSNVVFDKCVTPFFQPFIPHFFWCSLFQVRLQEIEMRDMFERGETWVREWDTDWMFTFPMPLQSSWRDSAAAARRRTSNQNETLVCKVAFFEWNRWVTADNKSFGWCNCRNFISGERKINSNSIKEILQANWTIVWNFHLATAWHPTNNVHLWI